MVLQRCPWEEVECHYRRRYYPIGGGGGYRYRRAAHVQGKTISRRCIYEVVFWKTSSAGGGLCRYKSVRGSPWRHGWESTSPPPFLRERAPSTSSCSAVEAFEPTPSWIFSQSLSRCIMQKRWWILAGLLPSISINTHWFSGLPFTRPVSGFAWKFTESTRLHILCVV